MRPGRRQLAGFLLAATLAAGCAPATSAEEPPEIPPTATDPANLAALKKAARIEECPKSDGDVAPVENGLPDLVVACLGGGRDVRLAGLRGKPMLINAWAQWCPPCREESPYLSEIAGADHRGLLILGIDYADPRPDYAIEFAQISGWRYPQLVDAEKALAGPLQLSAGPPQTLFVDADGVIVARHAGPFTSAAEIRDLVREHLGVRLG